MKSLVTMIEVNLSDPCGNKALQLTSSSSSTFFLSYEKNRRSVDFSNFKHASEYHHHRIEFQTKTYINIFITFLFPSSYCVQKKINETFREAFIYKLQVVISLEMHKRLTSLATAKCFKAFDTAPLLLVWTASSK